MKATSNKFSSILFLVFCIMSVAYQADARTKNKTATTDDKGIDFIEQDWDKALQQAKTDNKLIFLDIYATWCGPCKMLKRNTFTNEKVGEFFNKNFVNISVDGEKGIGPGLAQKYAIQVYPTLIVTDKDGNILLYTEGYMEPKYLLDFAKQALAKKS